jgi:predicted RNA-binding Zn ribbon-like protein
MLEWNSMPSERLSDTDPRAAEVLLALHRRMSPSEKVQAVFALNDMLMRLSEAGVRQVHPAADQREVFLRAAARRLGRETVTRVYGWDPGPNG